LKQNPSPNLKNIYLTKNMLNLEKATPQYDRTGWSGGYQSQKNEYAYPIDKISGTIPPNLAGTLFRNIPAMLDVNGVSVRHPFDGDGMICSIGFRDGQAYFRNRYVRTAGFVAEQAANKFLYRGVFGTAKAGGWLANAFDVRLKNIANTQVIYWGGKLLALWEAAEPHRLEPETLETIGLDYLDGVLSPGAAFSAHPRIDPAGRMVNFGLKTGLSTTIQIYEFDVAGKLESTYNHVVPGFAFIHDFAITPNYCIFFQNPVGFNPLPFLFGRKGPGECISFNANQPTKIIVIPRNRDRGESVRIFEAKSGFVFHHANAFETAAGLAIDSICYASFPEVEPGKDFRETDFSRLDPGQLWRFQLDFNQGTVERELLESRCCEFPTVNPEKVGQDYRYLYLGAAAETTGNAPLQAITKLDLATRTTTTWSAAPAGFLSEPIFVSKPQPQSEDDGWLMTLVFDSDRQATDVVILDARDLSVTAKLHLPHHLPYGLHGSWTEEVFAPL
jgi:all-trans-8'-apo-beta-carotenal 15,15'-oxygenase